MLSVIVCTRNRPELLGRCLEALALQEGSFEVVVVNQGDSPAAILADPRFRLITDQERGLAAGRNTGVRAAAGEVIAFLDDDAVPDPGYAQALEKCFEEDVQLAAAAGRILALEDGRPYARVHDATARMLGRGDWMHFLGGNFALRRAVVDRVGSFDERFGAGCRWASGEETDYFFRMQYRNCRIAYVPAAVVRHPREPVERAPRDLRRKLLAYGRGQGALMAHHLIDFANYRMLPTLLWAVTKPCLRAGQYALTLRWPRALLYLMIVMGKCSGFGEVIWTAIKK